MTNPPDWNAVSEADRHTPSNDDLTQSTPSATLPGEFRFNCLGGLDPEPRAASRKLLGVLALSALGIIAFLMIGLSVGFGVPNRNDLWARQSIRAIQIAQMEYASTFPATGYACSLEALGGDPKSGLPSPSAAQILNYEFSKGVDHGYFFEIRNCVKRTIKGAEQVTSYRVVAMPYAEGKSGKRGFCADQSGTIKYDPNGGDNCTLDLAD